MGESQKQALGMFMMWLGGFLMGFAARGLF